MGPPSSSVSCIAKPEGGGANGARHHARYQHRGAAGGRQARHLHYSRDSRTSSRSGGSSAVPCTTLTSTRRHRCSSRPSVIEWAFPSGWTRPARLVKPLDEDLHRSGDHRDEELSTRSRRWRSCTCSHSRTDAHEVRTREIIHSLYPDLFVSLSSEVNPIYREYERTAVTAFDAYMRPAVERALCTNMEQRLRDYGIGAARSISCNPAAG